MNEDGVKISQLPVADKLADGDVVAGVSEGETKAFPVDLLKGQTIEIAQEGGESATAVMSQKATTGAVAAEATARENAISAEATARSEAIQSLQSSVEANTAAISAEATARETADQSEATAREQAISALQTQVQTDLQNYYTKTQTDQMVSAIPKFAISVVQTLPTENISTTTVYLVPSGEESPNMYVEWIYAGDKWEELGAQTVDLTDYYTKTEADGAFVAKSDFTITADGQTRANNLPSGNIIRNFLTDNNSTATQAIVTGQRRDLSNGVDAKFSLNLPMASTTQAGCVTAADYSRIPVTVSGSAAEVVAITPKEWTPVAGTTLTTTKTASFFILTVPIQATTGEEEPGLRAKIEYTDGGTLYNSTLWPLYEPPTLPISGANTYIFGGRVNLAKGKEIRASVYTTASGLKIFNSNNSLTQI